MKFLTGPMIIDISKNILSEKKQVNNYSIDLTVKNIFKLSGGGELDFGGSEYKSAQKEPVIPELKTPEDKYKWWNLDSGSYIFEYNESLTLAEGQNVFIQPHIHLIESGAFHPSLIVAEFQSFKMPLYIMGNIVKIKQNARISELRVLSKDK